MRKPGIHLAATERRPLSIFAAFIKKVLVKALRLIDPASTAGNKMSEGELYQLSDLRYGKVFNVFKIMSNGIL